MPKNNYIISPQKSTQLSLFDVDKLSFSDSDTNIKSGKHGTFSPNHKQLVHRWYPYIEGFSCEFVESIIEEFCDGNCIYDPFAGTGTTVTVATNKNMVSYYSEINPFMRLVIECKTNNLKDAYNNLDLLKEYLESIFIYAKNNLRSLEEAQNKINQCFLNRNYFVNSRLIEIIAIKEAIEKCETPVLKFKDFAKLALGAIAVLCSEMKRASDLRCRKPNEKLPAKFSVLQQFKHKSQQICLDISQINIDFPEVSCLGESALFESSINTKLDFILTSPPYLNGTNYFRNTKLELWLTGFLKHEKELSLFRSQAMAAGINNISNKGRQPMVIPEVELIASDLDKVAYDSRIPELVRRYFSDSYMWLKKSYDILRMEGRLVVDIGDSRFAGVHVPTDKILKILASNLGLVCIEERLVRERKSKDGTELKQVLLIFEKSNTNVLFVGLNDRQNAQDYKTQAENFSKSLPYLEQPYSSRNWGNKLHSLCSYQGKLKPAIAHFLISQFTSPKDVVLDPMSGCGTIPLEAFLQGRYPLGNDLQELGYILTKTKIDRGANEEVYLILDDLLKYIETNKNNQDLSIYEDFGFNGKLPEYFNEETFKEILTARNYLKLNPCTSWGQALVYSCLLHILHGNRPYALSRRSHPVTPFKPTGSFEYRPLAPRLTDKIKRMLEIEYPQKLLCGMATQLPFSKLNDLYKNQVDVVITSPPFVASTRFFITNWMRLWLAGWEKDDFTSRQEQFLEYQQKKSMDIYFDFFKSCATWLKPQGKLIMHVGKTKSCNMAEELIKRSDQYFELIYSFDEDVVGSEKFGIKAQGATQSHQYLFFQKL
ncbi:DNA methyltransferase [Crocosphaera sp. XPORK-15E]|uniref:DNA methyltransferase n=1 Tax=Crocosphaera sp. XPORK-15E TaxID=3110247 RepID=UPI002B1FF0FF|nr:DNA methyltransferase [Crocosphaera sp. XPORK-15E]MEA5533159.1 DNA methyltransferase [Crocosphaera sp. XPORK-15E]